MGFGRLLKLLLTSFPSLPLFIFNFYLIFLFFYLFTFYMHKCLASVCAMCMPSACKRQKKTLGQGLELQTAMSNHVSAGNQRQVLCKSSQCSNHRANSPAPFFFFLSFDTRILLYSSGWLHTPIPAASALDARMTGG